MTIRIKAVRGDVHLTMTEAIHLLAEEIAFDNPSAVLVFYETGENFEVRSIPDSEALREGMLHKLIDAIHPGLDEEELE